MNPISSIIQRLLSQEKKASATGPIITVHTTGQPVWTPRNYENLAREGFMQNPVLYRCIRMIAESAASIPILLFEGQKELNSHPVLKLLKSPNKSQTTTDLLESWYGYLLVSGNAYMEAVPLNGQIRELHALRPDRMKVIPGSDGWPDAYEYSANGQKVLFPTEHILHMSLFHPANDHYGLSPLEPAATSIDNHNAGSAWNKALFDNSARPSGALVYQSKDGNLTQDQFERLKSELENNFQGTDNAGRPLLLEGGLDWKTMSHSPRDMDFIDAKNSAAREIALALGVPPMLLGIPGDNTYANYAEANRTFWRQTVLPLATRTLKRLSIWLGPSFGENIQLRPDPDQIEALSTEREALWDRVMKADFLTINEKRAAVGYEPVEHGDDL